MKSFNEVCDDTKEKLGRRLNGNELDFLQWVYKHYQDEKEAEEQLEVYAQQ